MTIEKRIRDLETRWNPHQHGTAQEMSDAELEELIHRECGVEGPVTVGMLERIANGGFSL